MSKNIMKTIMTTNIWNGQHIAWISTPLNKHGMCCVEQYQMWTPRRDILEKNYCWSCKCNGVTLASLWWAFVSWLVYYNYLINISYADTDRVSFKSSNNDDWHIYIEQKWMHLSGSYLCAIKSRWIRLTPILALQSGSIPRSTSSESRHA